VGGLLTRRAGTRGTERDVAFSQLAVKAFTVIVGIRSVTDLVKSLTNARRGIFLLFSLKIAENRYVYANECRLKVLIAINLE
jgi:hypothetical protein